MKLKIIQSIALFIFGISIGNAQNTELFRFVSKQTNTNGKHLVLHHNLTTNKAEVIAISNKNLNAKDGYLQAFIIKPLVSGSGEVLIASVKNPTYFLKSTNSNYSLALSTAINHDAIFSPIVEGEDLKAFSWTIEFSGEDENANPIVVLAAHKGDDDFYDGLSVSQNGEVHTNLITDADGNNREIIGSSSFNTKYLFTKQKILNVF